ncbi:hypothetical protein A2230_03845 [candidate division WOR-1 bacterium RIFOXYA2_FULL_36_21]|uniref:Deoxyhypusine synthase n=1 Tax=candidate division WOR-1 bacterium RIFOXYB2_FULL_36_35 TaxID=1802578 RepID=A0A1F4S1Y5_UNCSA|nr:MAG: hypothetical protein A2230_03845 [candidate division WOR-1 bacterium RIFOXYA2_FULL_36_21]OGC14456.1 MAG: hypothetical protein A2290_08540 [candidate division WOR-1 bacterium RIFOXYB2_FULL_36_35]
MPKRMKNSSNGRFDYLNLSPGDRQIKKGILKKGIKQIKITPSTTIAELVSNMADMSIQARNIGQCAKVLENMYKDKKRPTVFLGLAGPLIAAGLRSVIKDLIVNKAVDVVVSTGAIIFQDVYNALGHGHFKGSLFADDSLLHSLRIDRIYDTYVDEEMFWRVDNFCGRVADKMPTGNYSSRQYLEYLADEIDDEEAILYQCRKYGIPVFVPALNDSSIGIGLTEHRVRCKKEGKPGIAIDSIMDNDEIVQIVVNSKSTSSIYIAGGVPKNYINDAIVMGYIYGREKGHDYAVQITTAVVQDGGLSGSTLEEAKSWGKVDRKARSAMAWVEPSVSLPLLAGYILGRGLTKKRSRLKFKWEYDNLKEMKTG